MVQRLIMYGGNYVQSTKSSVQSKGKVKEHRLSNSKKQNVYLKTKRPRKFKEYLPRFCTSIESALTREPENECHQRIFPVKIIKLFSYSRRKIICTIKLLNYQRLCCIFDIMYFTEYLLCNIYLTLLFLYEMVFTLVSSVVLNKLLHCNDLPSGSFSYGMQSSSIQSHSPKFICHKCCGSGDI